MTLMLAPNAMRALLCAIDREKATSTVCSSVVMGDTCQRRNRPERACRQRLEITKPKAHLLNGMGTQRDMGMSGGS
jgi:hypothetical protein